MIRKYLGIILMIYSFAACTNQDRFSIEKGRVGLITSKTTINQLKKVFQQDSIVSVVDENKDNDIKSYYKDDDMYLIYEKGGKHLLTIVPMEPNDSSTIKSVEIFDARYVTKKGINLYSPFKDINAAYQLGITNTILSAHIDIDELNATMTIDKKDIGINEFNRDEIKPEQIPDLAKIKHFTIWFY